MTKDYSRSLPLQCSTCGGNQFETEAESDAKRCVKCGRVFTPDELQRENGARIDATVKEIGEEFISDWMRDFSKRFKGRK